MNRLAWHAIDVLSLSARSAVERVVDQVQPDVLVTHNLRGWGLAPWVVAHERGVPLVHVVHDYGLLCNSSTLFHDGGSCGKPCALRAEASIRRWPGGLLVGVSAAVLDEHRRRGFGEGAPSAVVHPVAAAQYPARTRRVRPSGAPNIFGYLGRVAPEKGVDLLLDALRGSGKELVVAGDGEASQVAMLKQRAAEGVQWRGWMTPDALFEEIDVLVVPSRWREPFGLVVVEAQRAGVPVLLADQPGLVEAAQASRARHRVFAANDVEGLRAALHFPLSDYHNDYTSPVAVDIAVLVGNVVASSGKRPVA